METSGDDHFQEHVYAALLEAEHEEKSSDLRFSPEQGLTAMYKTIERSAEESGFFNLSI
ncbi:hypothetical protein OZX62_09740 [Bifidobacterium sp. ESL0690]|uniref:hypothetical protein n=1 Tax=Bifidobacterium sp. ESL0690 TaxID=2983214 RepID=UPI0023F72588|nr:hypothetical protein [Bifidobacterium sp. ESL0690]WEV46691.1 hypothetical protein OZX62_09740 [Bifidobacterium sp. ESL0690]